MGYIKGWSNNMCIHIGKVAKKLYQDGIEVKEIKLDVAILHFVYHSTDTIWLKIKEK